MEEKLITIIKEAGKIFKKGYNSVKEVSFKGKKDLVTQYDVEVENFLKEKFSKEFEGFNIIAEESKNNETQVKNCIIIDPIDGTTNFVNNVPHCAISVGVYKDNKPYMGIVFNPVLDELYTAVAGQGAYLNGKKLQVSKDGDLQTSLIATGFPYTSSHIKDDLDFVINNLKSILPKCQDIRRLGSAAIDLCMVARGSYEGYYEINLKPWDTAAGIIILTEAGGTVSNHTGQIYDIFSDKCIVASNGKIHKELLSNINL